MHASSTASSADIDLGVLGTGRMGVRLAAMFARAGRRVMLASRTPERAKAIAGELRIPHLAAGSYEQALAAKAVLPAVFVRDGLFDLLDAYRAHLAGKLVIDIANPFNDDYSDYLLPWDTSAAEELQRLFPQSRVVGAFKNVFWEVFDAPVLEGQRSDVLMVGDDAQAKQARTIERLTLITGALGRQLGTYPRMNWKLLGETAAA